MFPINDCSRFSVVGSADDQSTIASLPGIRRYNGKGGWEFPLEGSLDAIAAASHALRPGGRLNFRRSTPLDPGLAAQREVTPSTTPDIHGWVWEWLMPFQREAIVRCNAFGGGYTHAAPGSGKSAIGVVWGCSSPVYCPIIVVTRAGSRPTWDRELRRYMLSEPWLAKPEAQMRKADLPLDEYMAKAKAESTRPVLVLGWESLVEWLKPVREAMNKWALSMSVQRNTPQYISFIADEIHKGKQNKRRSWHVDETGRNIPTDLENTSWAAEQLSRFCHRRIGLSATPIPNRTMDLWAQLDLLSPGSQGTFFPWAQRYCAAKQGEYGWDTSGTSNEGEMRARLSVLMHSIPHSVSHGQLPKKRREVRYLRPDEQNAEATGFTRELKQAAKEDRGQDGSRVAELKLTLAASRKRLHVVDEVREETTGTNHKVLIFTNRRKLREELTTAVHRKLPDLALWGVDGDDSVDAREAARVAYMAHPGPACFIATGDSMGMGVDLNDTDLFLIAMLPYTPEDLWQWEGRVDRLGGVRSCIIRYLIAEGTYDERVAAILLDKLPAVDALTPDEALAGIGRTLEGVEGHEDELLDSLFAKVVSRPAPAEWAGVNWEGDDETGEVM